MGASWQPDCIDPYLNTMTNGECAAELNVISAWSSKMTSQWDYLTVGRVLDAELK